MPAGINYNAFCADYSTMANCLFAIQAAEESGSLNAHPELIRALYIFDWGLLRKLYNRTAGILGALDGLVQNEGYIFFDFDKTDFNADFSLGSIIDPTPGYTKYFLTDTPGDYSEFDFSAFDFSVDIIDETNISYSSHFQTILNMFGVLCSRSSELSSQDIQAINAALIPVLETFADLQDALGAAGISLCAPELIHFNNSPYLYLQAAGSDGSTGVAAGIHLRWSLADDMGSNHLPKGNHYPEGSVTSGYNRPNDYISLSRIPYTNPVVFTVDFEAAEPAIDFDNKRWTYTINLNAGTRTITNVLLLTFKDSAQYDQLTVAGSPQADPFGFLKLYNGALELEVKNKAAFAFSCDFRQLTGVPGGILKIEVLSASLVNGVLTETANIRQTVAAAETPAAGKVFGDNIVKVRMQKTAGGFLQSYAFETYADFTGTREATEWEVIGNNFALTPDNNDTVFGWLETPAYAVDHLWPQYNDGTTVKIANYKDKWSISRPNDPSIAETVNKYLELSDTDPRAEDIIRDDGASPDDPGLLFSYLDVINIMALDYHLARMLGLGYIDAQVNGQDNQQYLYKISYVNLKGPASSELTTHEYISLPTALADARLPAKPQIRPVSYQISGDDGNNTAIDGEGYINNANIRVVNIGRQPYPFELLSDSFFGDLSAGGDFNLFKNARPVLYGIEYRLATHPNYVKPEITTQANPTLGNIYYAYDPDFPGTGLPETNPVPDNSSGLYVHFEKEAGVHRYALYAINWFSRASVVSDETATDETLFPLRNTLRPPADITAQYVQQEDTLLFTTAAEQGWLAGRSSAFPDGDINFTRLTFNWLDLTDISYVQDISSFDYATVLKPTHVKTWFKTTEPLQVVGVISAVVPVSGPDNLLLLYTGSYQLLDGSTVSPAIQSGDLARFTGSLLITTGGQFAVQSVSAGESGPVFTVAAISQVTNVEDPNEPNFYGTKNDLIRPAAGSRFTVTENLSEEANWLPVQEEIELVDFTNPSARVTETFVDDEGNITRYLVGGISAPAIITELMDPDNNIVPGYYLVTFAVGTNLAAHPQAGLPFDPANPDANAPGTLHPPDVGWYNGLVRAPVNGSPLNKKMLQVVRIVQTGPVQLIVYDGASQDDPIQLSATGTDLVDAVNFHPGYKTYLFPEPAPAHDFNGSNILPAAGLTSKKSLVGLQMADERPGGSGYISAVSPPVILLARRIEQPVRPEMPSFFGLKVRPDAINKAAFTLDLKIAPGDDGSARSPFGVTFFRTTNENVLNALYNPGTVATILNALGSLTTDAHFDQRYGELVNLVFDPDHPGQFRIFDAEPAPYGFPVPDKTGLTSDGDSQETKEIKYNNAIMRTLLPLSVQVPVFSYLKEGQQTDKKQPTLRSADGTLLGPADPLFDPFPMVRKYTKDAEPATTYIRFTDYSLNGSSRFLYFYAGAEVTSQLVTGELSPFAGPVSIVHTRPPEAPVVRYFTLGPPAFVSTAPIAVSFSLTPFLPGDPVTRVRVYRAFNPDDTFSLQSMTSYFDVAIVLDVQYGIVVNDDFSDMTILPTGEVIYYRLAFVRPVINEKDEAEDIIGFGSEVIAITLIDTVNPDAPELTYAAAESKLSWPPTTNKGTYYLYTQNSRGNWQIIYKVQPASATAPMEYVFPEPLVLTDGDGNRVYYRYKVKAENSSGLLNLTDKELTI